MSELITRDNLHTMINKPEEPEVIAYKKWSEASEYKDQGLFGMSMLASHIVIVLGHNTEGIVYWRRRRPPHGPDFVLDRFEDYLLKPVREGLGLPSLYFLDKSLKLLIANGNNGGSFNKDFAERALEALYQEIPDWDDRIREEEARQLVKQRRIVTGKRGGDRKSDNIKANNVSIDSNKGNSRKAQHGNNRAYILSRLESERPDLFDRVVSGELSANKAAINAGWKKQKSAISIALDAFNKLNDTERKEFINQINLSA